MQDAKELHPLTFSGHVFSLSEIELIQQTCRNFASLGRTEISRTICELLAWKRPNGGLKNHECRLLLERMQDLGLLILPPLGRSGKRGTRLVRATSQSEPEADLVGSVGEFDPLSLSIVVSGDAGESRLWRELIERYHYLHCRVPVGANLRYLVRSQRAPDRVLACMLWTSPAWKMAVRDRWIGWNDEQRRRNLQLIVNNARYLILPWVHVRGLASKVLSLCARQLPGDWERRYGYRPLLLETLVDSQRFRGTSYRAANWLALGQTKGGGRTDRLQTAQDLSPKEVYVYPLCRNVQERLQTATAPVFSGSDKDQDESWASLSV
jgi:Druantia protein DruA